MLFEIRQGDRLPVLGPLYVYDPVVFTVVDAAGLALVVDPVLIDFSLYQQIEFAMEHVETGTVIGGPAIGTSLGELTYPWKVGDSDLPGTYRGFFRVWDAEGRPQSLPSPPITVIVRAR